MIFSPGSGSHELLSYDRMKHSPSEHAEPVGYHLDSSEYRNVRKNISWQLYVQWKMLRLLRGVLFNFLQTCMGHDLGWVNWCMQHQVAHRLGSHINAPGMITDTHDNNIYAQKLNRNRTFFNRCMFSQRLAFKHLLFVRLLFHFMFLHLQSWRLQVNLLQVLHLFLWNLTLLLTEVNKLRNIDGEPSINDILNRWRTCDRYTCISRTE